MKMIRSSRLIVALILSTCANCFASLSSAPGPQPYLLFAVHDNYSGVIGWYTLDENRLWIFCKITWRSGVRVDACTPATDNFKRLSFFMVCYPSFSR